MESALPIWSILLQIDRSGPQLFQKILPEPRVWMEGTVCLIDYDLVHGRPWQCTTTTFILSCREFTVQASLLIQRSAYSQRPQSRSLATLLSIGNQKLSREGPGAQKSSEFRRFLGMLKYLRKSIPRRQNHCELSLLDQSPLGYREIASERFQAK